MQEDRLTFEGLKVSDFNAFISKVFLNMFLGLILTAICAYMTVSTGLVYSLSGWGWIGFAIFSFLLVISTGLLRHNGILAGISFYAFSAVEGTLLAPILIVYTGKSIITAFALSGMLFGLMALLAMTNKVDFRRFGVYFLVGLIGIILASLLNVFLFKSAGISFGVSVVTIILFLGLTIYDIQTLEDIAYTDGNAFFGALSLYLDFINLFIAILNIMGERRR